MTEQRRLAAVVCADVAGYSRLMGADEEGTIARLRELRAELIDPKIAEHHGRIVKTTGDGALLEFASAVDAVRCMLELQQANAERNAGVPADRRIEFRVGINVGDIVIDGDDILGDGVNVAARLETLAEPGEICVSRGVRDAARDKLPIMFQDRGSQQVKNIARPVQVYRVQAASAEHMPAPLPPTHASGRLRWALVGGGLAAVVAAIAVTIVLVSGRRALQEAPAQAAVVASAPAAVAKAAETPALAVPADRPSIAVLPFANMSDDKSQEYFADGVAEDIITALSRFRSLFVIARNSSFTYKGKQVDIRLVGRELGVRYVLEGSVRRAGNRVRVTGQLIEAATGNHLWAEQYDGDLGDVFALQDRITEAVAGAIAPTILQAEVERTRRSAPRSFDAYDLFLRGMALPFWTERDSNARALELFEQAIQADPRFVRAVRGASTAWAARASRSWISTDEAWVHAWAQALDYAQRAVLLEPDNAESLALLALRVLTARGPGLAERLALPGVDEAVAMANQALALNANSTFVLNNCGWVYMFVGQPDAAILHLERLLRLSPKDRGGSGTWTALATAHMQLGRYQEAIIVAQTAQQYSPKNVDGWIALASALALAGRLDDARIAAARVRELQPDATLGGPKGWRTWYERVHPTAHHRWLEGLRLAGLPE